MPLAAITTACHLIRWFCTLTPQSGLSLLRPPAKRPSVARYRPKQGFHFGSAWKTLGVQVHQSGLGCIWAGRRHLRSLPSVTSTTRSICELPVLALVCVRGDTQGKPIEDCRVRLSRPSSTASSACTVSSARGRRIGGCRAVLPRRGGVATLGCRCGSGRRCVVTCSSRHCRRGVRGGVRGDSAVHRAGSRHHRS